LTLVLEYERIKNKTSKYFKYVLLQQRKKTRRDKLFDTESDPQTKTCKIYGVGVKLIIGGSLKENSKVKKLTINSNLSVTELVG